MQIGHSSSECAASHSSVSSASTPAWNGAWRATRTTKKKGNGEEGVADVSCCTRTCSWRRKQCVGGRAKEKEDGCLQALRGVCRASHAAEGGVALCVACCRASKCGCQPCTHQLAAEDELAQLARVDVRARRVDARGPREGLVHALRARGARRQRQRGAHGEPGVEQRRRVARAPKFTPRAARRGAGGRVLAAAHPCLCRARGVPCAGGCTQVGARCAAGALCLAAAAAERRVAYRQGSTATSRSGSGAIEPLELDARVEARIEASGWTRRVSVAVPFILAYASHKNE